MSEHVRALRALEWLGGCLVERFGSLNVWTAFLLAGALVVDRALARRVRAAWRIALYAPVALRVVLPLDWSVPVAHAPKVLAYFTPVLQLFGAPSRPEAAAAGFVSWHAVAGGLYLVVVALLVVPAVRARVNLERALASATPVPSRAHPPCLITEAARRGSPIVRHEVLGPMAVGVLAPRIVIPERLLIPGEEAALDCVLRHELAHLRRGDPWLSVAMQTLVVLAWPVLPLWLAVARARQLVELACDEAALAGADATERRRYGHALLDIAEWSALAVAPLDVGELHFGSTLRARIEALAAARQWPIAAQVVALSCASLLLLGASSGSLRPSASMPPTSASSAADDDAAYGYEFEVNSAKNTTIDPAALSLPNGPEDRVPPEAVQAVVRAHYPAFNRCYEAGVARDRSLAGRVSVKAVAGVDGSTKQAVFEKGTLRDDEVVACVVREFGAITYRKGGGNLTLIYPLEFSP